MLRCRFRRVSRGSRVAAVRNHCEQRRNATRFGIRAILHHIGERSVIRFQVIGSPLARLSRTGPSRSALVQICEWQVMHVCPHACVRRCLHGLCGRTGKVRHMIWLAEGNRLIEGPSNVSGVPGAWPRPPPNDGRQQFPAIPRSTAETSTLVWGQNTAGIRVDREEVSTGTGGIDRARRTA